MLRGLAEVDLMHVSEYNRPSSGNYKTTYGVTVIGNGVKRKPARF